MVRPIKLVDGTTSDLVDDTTTHRNRRSYDQMVGPIHLADGDRSTWPLVGPNLVETMVATYPLRRYDQASTTQGQTPSRHRGQNRYCTSDMYTSTCN